MSVEVNSEVSEPNLAGDDVNFVRFDVSTGEITSYGTMHRDHIAKEQEDGGSIIETEQDNLDVRNFKVNVVTREIEPHVFVDPEQASKDKESLLISIMNKLASTDKYFMADALDNIDAQTQSMYRNYRKALRAAAKLDTADAIRAAMPADIRSERIRVL